MSRKHPKFHSNHAGKTPLKAFPARPEDPAGLDSNNWKAASGNEIIYILKVLLLKINTVQKEASYWYFAGPRILKIMNFKAATVGELPMTMEQAIYHLQWMIKVYEDPTIPENCDPADPVAMQKIEEYRSQDIVLPFGPRSGNGTAPSCVARFVKPHGDRIEGGG